MYVYNVLGVAKIRIDRYSCNKNIYMDIYVHIFQYICMHIISWGSPKYGWTTHIFQFMYMCTIFRGSPKYGSTTTPVICIYVDMHAHTFQYKNVRAEYDSRNRQNMHRLLLLWYVRAMMCMCYHMYVHGSARTYISIYIYVYKMLKVATNHRLLLLWGYYD